ncbi:AAA family ATPase [Synechococcus elongatus]|uniref:Nuclease SbcCD subunit C n=2 Tax=Synechococcus elongatus TaxID=32046 RepID=Q54762_SYNE7|nr:SMC family ATPase [Synechococcus elongatus]AAB82027.1 unknown [Synechococcus elongatus PCC 7942 = FACHB-805]ABB58593.1 exonuclease SbcC [Synechococcus elongatus PCC 7942 = FACHB-805]AJD56954.1 exonuclease SbcC [Synechococcus elongatus UTEX 2973]MBD2587313.1 SMC family ATPase [Synechococcus elongatus FACHB-242]MBD2688382.1 SMC family ATPase [Synechococcus elongatus FACHB-1061]
MILLRLQLHHFLSYREADLALGQQLVVVSGVSGSGKTALLEAIAWALWGQSLRGDSQDLIQDSADWMAVTLEFQQSHQQFQVQRRHDRQTGTQLQLWQRSHPDEPWAEISQSTAIATQAQLTQVLGWDYTHFCHTVYVPQGQPSPWVQRSASDRYQQLAHLFQLDRLRPLALAARDRDRSLQAEEEWFFAQRQQLQQQADQQQQLAETRSQYQQQLAALQQQRAAIDQQQQTLEQRWQAAEHQQRDRQALAQQIQQLQTQLGDQQRLLAENQQRQAQAQHILSRALSIRAEWQQWQQSQQQASRWAQQTEAQQALSEQLQQVQRQYDAAVRQHQQAIATVQQQLQAGQEALVQFEPLLQQATAIAAGYQQLQQARQELAQAQQRHTAAQPLLAQRQQVQTQLGQARLRLQAHLEDLQGQRLQLRQQHRDRGELEQALASVSQTITQLEQHQHYRNQVQEKQQERSNFLARLQARQRDYEAQLAELESQARAIAPHGTCPLCDQALDPDHWQHLQQRYQQQQTEIQNLIWVICEQFAVSEREIQVLRQEYRDRAVDLEPYSQALEERGKLQAQLVAHDEQTQQLQQLDQQIQTLERSLAAGDFAPDLQRRVRQLDRQIQELGYRDRDLNLAQQTVDQWQAIAERYAALQAAQAQQQRWDQERPRLETQLRDLQQALNHLSDSPLGQHRQQLQRQLQQVEASLRGLTDPQAAPPQAEVAERYQALLQAEQAMPRLQAEQADLEAQVQQLQKILTASLAQQAAIATAEDRQPLQQAIADCQAQLQAIQAAQTNLEQAIAQLPPSRNLEAIHAQIARLDEQLQQIQQEQQPAQQLATLVDRADFTVPLMRQWLRHLQLRCQHWLDRWGWEQGQLLWQVVSPASGAPGVQLRLQTDQGDRSINTCADGEAVLLDLAIRLSLVQLLAQQPDRSSRLLILDAPFSSLNPQQKNALTAALTEELDQGLICEADSSVKAIAADTWHVVLQNQESQLTALREAATGTGAD